MDSARRLFPALFLCLLVGGVTQFAPPALPQANVQGQWQTLPYTVPINPIHVTLLHTGKVLIVSGSGNLPSDKNFEAALWDPQAGTITTQPVGWDMFCNGMIVLPDGRVFIAGGTIQYDPFYGQPRTSIYDPATNTFTDQQMMAHGRWYPTATVLGDGRVMVFSGTNETGTTNTTVEIYTEGSGFGPEVAVPWTPPLYPHLHLLPNGNVFYSGSTPSSSIFNPSTNSWTTNVATTNYGGSLKYGSSVLLPLTPANGYKPQVMIFGGDNPSTATTEIIDLSVANPQWVYGPSMSSPRIEMDATMLPNGKILASGGSLNDEDARTASRNADLYDPNTNTFSTAATDAYDRFYHSVTLLMPDATVWVAGSNPARGTYEPHMEIYSPPYLFNSDGSFATRPSLTSLSSSVVGYGGAFTVQTPDAGNISTVVMMRNGASTHALDMEQRYVGLSFTAGSGILNVMAPPNGNIAPPGFYMLFLLNGAGVPSVAAMVQVSTGTSTLAVTPTFNPAGGTYSGTQSVSISDTTAGAAIFYTLDGSTPATSVGGSTKQYSAPISVAATETIKAIATATGFSSSVVGSAAYTISGPPSIISLLPSSGSGVAQTFTMVYSDPNGMSDLKTTRVSVGTGTNACYVSYSPGTNQLFLYNNAGTGLSAAVTPGSSAMVSNSQCTLSGTGSSFSKSGNSLTLSVALTFSATFTGQQKVYLYANGNDGLNSGWVHEGDWTP